MIGPLPKAITWDHTRQSIKLGVSQAKTVAHIHPTGKTDEGNSTGGALFPAVTVPYHLASNSLALALFLSLSLSLSLFLSLSLSFCGKFLRTMSYVVGVV